MKKTILLIIFTILAFTFSSCKASTATNKDISSEKTNTTSASTQTETITKDEATNTNSSDQTEDLFNELTNASDTDINCEEIFTDFLVGETEAYQNKNKEGTHYIDSLDGPYEYAFYDMNSDDVPELIIRTRISLEIYWIYDNELILWHSDVHYTKPLNNMALLYEQRGGGPEHINYKYIVLGYYGEELLNIDFSEYYAFDSNGVQYNALYFINNTKVQKATYDTLSERLLNNISDDKIEWVSLTES